MSAVCKIYKQLGRSGVFPAVRGRLLDIGIYFRSFLETFNAESGDDRIPEKVGNFRPGSRSSISARAIATSSIARPIALGGV
ncbi:MAG: hypothetical protein ACP5D7_09575 [Limnospira sp.]